LSASTERPATRAGDARGRPLRLLLVGKPGCGKTTLLLRLLSRFPNRFSGFVTEERRGRDGERVGFSVRTLRTGRTAVLASRTIRPAHRVGRYGVDVAAFERCVTAEVEEALEEGRPLAMDEIGGMELLSEKFRALVERALDSESHLVATIHARRHPFTDRLKERSDVRIVRVRRGDADRLLAEATLSVAEEVMGLTPVPVGVFRTPFRDPTEAPRQGAETEGWIDIHQEYAEAVTGLRPGARLDVYWWMDAASRSLSVAGAEGKKRGVFGLRSPSRPNPVGHTRVRLLAIDGRRLRVKGVDAVDGSIVIDVKAALEGAC